MRHVYRTITFASLMIATGSFIIDLGTFLRDGAPATEQTQTAKTGNERGQADETPTCDTRFYESAKQRLRSEGQSTKRRWEWLGADRQHDYFYDFRTGEIMCEKRQRPGPVISPSKAERKSDEEMPPETRFAVLACLTVIGVCGTALVLIRRRRLPDR